MVQTEGVGSMLSVVQLDGLYQVVCGELFLDCMRFVYMLVAVYGMPGIFCLRSSFLSRCGGPSDTRLCNITKQIYILNRCWSQTSCHGPARFVQSWVKFAYVC